MGNGVEGMRDRVNEWSGMVGLVVEDGGEISMDLV